MNLLLTQNKFSLFNTDLANNPIALLDLAPYLRRLGHNVDCFYLNDLPNRKYDLVGLSVLNYERDTLKNIFILKNKFKQARIVVGGKATRGFSSEEMRLLQKSNIEIWDKSGEEYFSGEKDIDYAHYPSWDKRDLKALKINHGGIMSSRGCPYHCHFCHNTESELHFFPARRTVDNIELLFDAGVKCVSFADDIFTLKASHMSEIYSECKRRNIPIEGKNTFFTHVNHINEDSVKAMAFFKPFSIQLGIESGDDEMLIAMGKGFNVETAYEKVKFLAGYAPVTGLFLIGFPKESRKSLENTLRFVKRINKYLKGIWVSFYNPVFCTVGYNLALENGVILTKQQNNTKIGYLDKRLALWEIIRYRALILGSFFKSKKNWLAIIKYFFIDLGLFIYYLPLALKIKFSKTRKG
jgi:radical SAM superfamily enzyme YgiQ (UPF0313 family)